MVQDARELLSRRTRAAVYDIAEVLGADLVRRIISGEGLRLPAFRLPAPIAADTKMELLLQALAGVSAMQQHTFLLRDGRRLAEWCFDQLDWTSGATTLAALQAVEEFLWEFDQARRHDDELDSLRGARLRRSLATDGFTIDGDSRISPPLSLYLDNTLSTITDPAVILVLLARVRRSPHEDPMLAIGTAKELVESTAKITLDRLGISYSPSANLPSLVADAQKAVAEHPSQVLAIVDADKEVRKLLGYLSGASNALAALRNDYGTGHGPSALPDGLRPRHGRLAIAAADAWCTYMLDALTDLPLTAVPSVSTRGTIAALSAPVNH